MVPQPPAVTVLRGLRKPHWCCGQCGRAGNWACRIHCLCGGDAPAAIVSRAHQKHKEADAGGGGGKKAGFKQGGSSTQGIPKQLAEWMQAIEMRLAPPDKEWPKPGGTAPWREAADGADPDKKSQSAKLGERITELEECLKKLPPADERNKDLLGPTEKKLETHTCGEACATQDPQRARNGLEKLEKELGEKERQLDELAKGIATRKETIAAKKLEVAALDAEFSESAKNVTTVAADIVLVEEDVADQPDLVAVLKSEAWVKLKSAVASNAAARAASIGTVPPAADAADEAMPAPTEVQKRALYHARSEGSVDDFTSAFDTMWSELAAKRARHGPTVGAEFSVETYNASGGKASVKKRLASAVASVVLLQEFGHISEQHVLIDLTELPVGLHAFNVHLHTGEGAAGRNDRLLQELGLAAEALGGPAVIGGGWNMCPGDAEHAKRLVYTAASKMGTQITIGPQDLAMAAEEILNFTAASYHVQGLAARLDRYVQQARGMLQAIFDEEARRVFLGDIEPDVKLAVN
ncbi:unnamed protein product [Prorocentrum cordatum]|uniref:Uncharacterized protein n=1 Tax=Prorocentrum cordatum TaxID=2364126 RepID=A0ABN9PXU1_9DINO|nr:unnamed protein product [Polarella glacialis]